MKHILSIIYYRRNYDNMNVNNNDNRNLNKISKKKMIISIFGLLLVLITIVGIGYALYVFVGTGSKENVITTGKVDVNYTENSVINLMDQYPVNDTTGITETASESEMSFTLSPGLNTGLNYAIALDSIVEGTTLTENYIKIYLLKGDAVASSFTEGQGKLISSVKPILLLNSSNEVLIDHYVIHTDTFTNYSSQTYTLKAWIDESYDLPQTDISSDASHGVQTTSETFSFKIRVVATDDTVVATADNNSPTCTWTSGPSTTPIYNGATAMYVLNCTDWSNFSDSDVTTSDFTVSNNIISVTNVIKSTITGGYSYTVTVTANSTIGTANLQLKANAISDVYDNYNVASSNSSLVTVKGLLYLQILNDNPVRSTRSSFNAVFSDSNNGNTIYSTSTNTENSSVVYYFAGSVSNNWVKLGSNYWRIVRINEDNSVRLIWVGSATSVTSVIIGSSSWYSSTTEATYGQYMISYSSDSTIKGVIDSWYVTNLNSYDSYISKTAIYCNDWYGRSIGSGDWATDYYTGNTRLTSSYSPQFKCNYANDKYSVVSTSGGNAKLTRPIGLLSGDEAAYAGAKFGTASTSIWLSDNTSAAFWWLMTPNLFYHDSSNNRYQHTMSYSDKISADYAVSSSIGVRPVISLKSCVYVTRGNGTSTSPYEVISLSACQSSNN